MRTDTIPARASIRRVYGTRSLVVAGATTLGSAALLVLMFMRLLQAGGAVATAPTSPVIGHRAPDFTITSWNGTPGQQIHLAAFAGRPVVVNFWGSWCAECVEEQPVVNAAWQHYQAQGVQFIGIAYNDIADNGTAYLKQYGVTYPAGPASSDSVAVDYSVTGAPETVFIGRNGVVVNKIIGPLDDRTLDREIQAILKSGG
ncbi:MAG TPA: redoxin domain-containing protein [Ktedonobacterales bacterium]|nr:redoxin domain-containing protein [Ktedonobacterales bacterium]